MMCETPEISPQNDEGMKVHPFSSSVLYRGCSRCDSWSCTNHLRPQDGLKKGSHMLSLMESFSLVTLWSHHTSLLSHFYFGFYPFIYVFI